MGAAADSVALRYRALAWAKAKHSAQWVKRDGRFAPISYEELWSQAETLGAGLLELGVRPGDHVGLIADNRPEWLAADLAVLGLGAADVPRGSDSTVEEIGYILSHAACGLAFAENPEQVGKILKGLPAASPLKTLVVLDDTWTEGGADSPPNPAGPPLRVLNLAEALALGRTRLQREPACFDALVSQGHETQLATIIYTSGTTGLPKGVRLPHRSFLFQMDRTDAMLQVDDQDILLSVLPIWHSFERACEYIIMSKGGAIAYSKPIGKILLDDMAAINPTFFPSVPRIWESVKAGVLRTVKAGSPVKQALFNFFLTLGLWHDNLLAIFTGRMPAFYDINPFLDKLLTALPLLLLTPLRLLGGVLVFKKIKVKLGSRFKAGISGGGALPPHVDDFFRAAGIKVLEGYGLTETGPVLSVRVQWAPMPRTVGPLLPDIEFKILDEQGRDCPPGVKGVLHVRSPQVMEGYHERPDETAKVLSPEGWLNTGDLVVRTTGREIRIVGRAKDTIVLMGGENIEPEPIENKIKETPLVDQVMVVGQDQKVLGALVVPNFEALEAWANERGLTFVDREGLVALAPVVELIHEEIQGLVNPKTGFKIFERIYKTSLLAAPFEPLIEMTASLKLKRNVIADRHAERLRRLFAD